MKYLLLLATLLVLLPLAHSQAIAFPGRGPVGSITATGSYIFGESEGGSDHTLWGWSAAPEINITRRIGLQAEIGSYYERINPGEKRLVLTAGPRYNFSPVLKLWPFVYAEGGEMKLSFKNSSYTDWDPVARVGIGFEHRILRNVSVTVVPAEYLAHNLDAGGWTHDFSAHAGFTYNFYRGRGPQE
jgi:hypothetical protein